VFATRRRKRRSAMMKQELGQSVEHLKRAATLAAQETGATVGPKFSAAKGRVQPVTSKAKGTASSGWETAVATLTPLVAAAAENVRQNGATTAKATKRSAKASKRSAKAEKKNAKKLEKKADKMLDRGQTGRRTGRLFGLALVGAAVGTGAALLMRRRKAQQWDEYDPAAPIGSTQPVTGADDAAFEPVTSTEPATPATPVAPVDPVTPIEPVNTTKKD
jgi:hypothetical protein